MLEYEFEQMEYTSGLFSLYLDTTGYQEIIRKRAAQGWRFAGWIPMTQAQGFIKTIDLVFERETAEQE